MYIVIHKTEEMFNRIMSGRRSLHSAEAYVDRRSFTPKGFCAENK